MTQRSSKNALAGRLGFSLFCWSVFPADVALTFSESMML